jgi:hypothetical protein
MEAGSFVLFAIGAVVMGAILVLLITLVLRGLREEEAAQTDEAERGRREREGR